MRITKLTKFTKKGLMILCSVIIAALMLPMIALASPDQPADGQDAVAAPAVQAQPPIKKIAKGQGGFGYDPYFYIDDSKTMAELTLEEKNKISHRGVALCQMVTLFRL